LRCGLYVEPLIRGDARCFAIQQALGRADACLDF
jgi:hypothetical protein